MQFGMDVHNDSVTFLDFLTSREITDKCKLCNATLNPSVLFDNPVTTKDIIPCG